MEPTDTDAGPLRPAAQQACQASAITRAAYVPPAVETVVGGLLELLGTNPGCAHDELTQVAGG